MLLEILNPFECLHDTQLPNLTQIHSSDMESIKHDDSSRFVIFVHGIDYGSPIEVIKDFIKPFESAARLLDQSRINPLRFLIYHWDSKLDILANLVPGHSGISSIGQALLHPRIFLKSLTLWRSTIQRFEAQAKCHAQPFSDVLKSMTLQQNQNTSNTMVVSHSMGSYIVAHSLNDLSQTEDQVTMPIWWNFQPSIKASDFGCNGIFAKLGIAYALKNDHFRLWHSRVDLVLILTSILGLRSLSSGLIGISSLAPMCRDVTWQAWEAHGSLALGRKARCFFARTAKILRLETQALMKVF